MDRYEHDFNFLVNLLKKSKWAFFPNVKWFIYVLSKSWKMYLLWLFKKWHNQSTRVSLQLTLSFKSTSSILYLFLSKTIFWLFSHSLAIPLHCLILLFIISLSSLSLILALLFMSCFLFAFSLRFHPQTPPLPPLLLSFYLNCKWQQCRLPEELLNVIRADPVD